MRPPSKPNLTLLACIAAAAWCGQLTAQAAPSVGLIDFNATPGDFTVVSTNNPPNPWTYDSIEGRWISSDTADCLTAFRSSRLNSPALTVVNSGTVSVSFTHRYSFEADTTRWDGGQLRISVNGGAYVTVPAGSFSANGYNNTIGGAAVPNSELAGQSAFTAESTGYSSATYITSVATLGTFNAGDTISVQFIAAWDDCSQGQVPNWEIDRVQFTPSLEDRRPPPSFANAALPLDAAVVEGRSHTLRAIPVGYVSLQWYKDDVAIPGATATNYTIASMSAADVGSYHLVAINSIGTATSRAAAITLTDDETPPVMLMAFSDASDLTLFTIVVDEPLCVNELDCGSSALDYFNYSIQSLDGTLLLDVAMAAVVDGTNVNLVTAQPRTPGVTYKITLDGGLSIGDLFGNTIPLNTPASQITIVDPIAIQQGVDGYAGTQDTELRGAAPGTVQGNNTFVTVDTSDGGAMSQGLLRFDGLIGPGHGQIPAGATIISARLTLTHGNGATPDGDPVNLHRMLISWDQSTATYNSLVGGVSADGIEARPAADLTVISAGLVQGGKLTFNVANSVQAWANGEANHGWAFIPTSSNGYRWDTSESSVPGSQPRLEVLYTVPPCSPVSITGQPASTTTVNEGDPFTLSVTVQSEGCPPTFQWTRNGVDIPGATSSALSIASANPTTDGGTYRVRVENSLPSTETSAAAVVVVVADTVKPSVVSAASEADGTTITVIFSEEVSASAENNANYSLAPSGGGLPLVLTVTRINATTVQLISAPRALGSTFNLTISGISDVASTPNTIDTVVIPISTSAIRLLDANAVWKYDQTGNYDATLAGGATPWHSPLFDDSAWASGQGLFGLESAGVIATIPFSNPVILTPWTVGAAQLTYYLRTTINVPAIPPGATVVLRHATDDGMVAYVDGEEKTRYNMAVPDPILNATLAPAAGPEGVVVCAALDITAGSHTLAVEVHQSSTTSSDVVFGAELLLVIQPSVQVTRNADGSVTAVWENNPLWALVQATDVAGPYTPVAGNPASPYTVSAPIGNVFFQLQCQ